jgi:hypothetical protein
MASSIEYGVGRYSKIEIMAVTALKTKKRQPGAATPEYYLTVTTPENSHLSRSSRKAQGSSGQWRQPRRLTGVGTATTIGWHSESAWVFRLNFDPLVTIHEIRTEALPG